MKRISSMKSLLLILFLALAAGHSRAASQLETMFSYQGFLSVNGSPANSSYDMMFTLFRVGEPMPGPSVTLSNVPVVRGLFTAGIDFGPGVFDGTAHELSVAVREAGAGGPFAPLQPRQPLRATPNASFALTVGRVPDTSLSTNVALLNGSPMFSSPISVTLLRVADAGGGGLLRFGPTDDCTVGVDPQGASGLLLRDPRGIRLLSPDPMSPPVLRFGPTDDCSIGINPALSGLVLRDPRGIRLLSPDPMSPPVLRFGPTDDCSIGIDPAFPGLIERDPIGFRLLGRNSLGCRLIFGPTMDCTVEVDPTGPQGLLLRDPRGIRIVPRDAAALPVLRFGPTDDCSIGINPALTGLLLRDPRGIRLLSPDPMSPPTLRFGPTDDCSIGINPAVSGLLLRDPRGIRVLSPDSMRPPTLLFGPTDDCSIGIDPTLAGLRLRDPGGLRIAPTSQTALPRLLFGPTDDCSLGIDPAFPGLVERDPVGFRLLGRNLEGCRLIFGPTMDCTVEVDPTGPQGLLLRDPRGIRIVPRDAAAPPVLRFGPTDDCSIGIDPALTGLLLRDPRGVRIAPAATTAQPRLLFGPTDDCSLGIDPAFPGLVERDPVGLRLLGQNDQGGRLIFGPTDLCTIEVQRPVAGSIAGLLLRDPRGVRILSPSPINGTNTILFGPTDDCRISAPGPNGGMSFADPRGFTFASQVAVNGPVFAQDFVPISSRRFKDDVKPIEKPLEKISQLQGVRFTWSEDKGGRDDIGFIAEDVAKVIPEVVAWEEDGQNARGVNYDHLVAVAIEGIKAQQSQIQTLEREKTELKDSLATVQARLDRLSQQLDALLAR